MAFQLGFGKHAKRSLEWLFFNDPGYVWWMIDKDIASKRLYNQAQDRFHALAHRASHLWVPGLCSWCKKRPITRMFLTMHINGGLASVDFDCDECRPLGGSPSSPLHPGFFTPDFYRSYDKTGARFLIHRIKHAYFGNESFRMTQKRLEAFFDDPTNFIDF